MTNTEHLNNLIRLHTQRLQNLEAKAALYGTLMVPFEITNEIEIIHAEIAKLNASLTALSTVVDLGNDTGTANKPIDRRDESNQELRTHIMLATVQATVAEFLSLRKFVTDEIDGVKVALSKQTNYGVVLALGIFGGFIIIIALILYRS